MGKTAIVFIDGNNWYHNSKALMIKPSHIDFKKLSKFICDHFKFTLKEPIRYYNSVPSIVDGNLKYHSHMEFLSSLEKDGIKVITRKLQRSSTREVIKEKRDIIGSLDLCDTCKPLVIQNCDECIGNVKMKEKGIDVEMAVDVIRKCIIEKECDCCVLITGDADFIPAMQLIKNNSGKEAVTSSVRGGYSNKLREGKFRYLILKKNDIANFCLKDYKKFKKRK